ncbi:rRNA maturation RNase YbeY [Chloroflexota bacterium]
MEINILIDEELEWYLEVNWLERVIRHTLVAQGTGPDVELGLVITGQEQIRQLNRRYRDKDEPTDVLAFTMLSAEETTDTELTSFVVPPDGKKHLGEVIVSYPQAVTQAEEHQHSVKREVAVLITHGVLHLLGYDHDGPELEQEMRAMEVEVLSHIAEELEL